MQFLVNFKNKWKQVTQPKADGCCLTGKQQKAGKQSSTNRHFNTRYIFFFFSKTSVECDSALSMATKSIREHKKVFLLTPVCCWYRARRMIPAWGVSGCSGVAAKEGLCVSNGRGVGVGGGLSQICFADPTLPHSNRSGHTDSWPLPFLALQDQNNNAASHTLTFLPKIHIQQMYSMQNRCIQSHI